MPHPFAYFAKGWVTVNENPGHETTVEGHGFQPVTTPPNCYPELAEAGRALSAVEGGGRRSRLRIGRASSRAQPFFTRSEGSGADRHSP